MADREALTRGSTRDALPRKIALIDGAEIFYEDHGILTGYVFLSYGSAAQGAGGYAFDEYDQESKQRVVNSPFGMRWMVGVMRAAGVQKWGDLKGRRLFAVLTEEGFSGQVVGLEPLPTDDGAPFFFEDAK